MHGNMKFVHILKNKFSSVILHDLNVNKIYVRCLSFRKIHNFQTLVTISTDALGTAIKVGNIEKAVIITRFLYWKAFPSGYTSLGTSLIIC